MEPDHTDRATRTGGSGSPCRAPKEYHELDCPPLLDRCSKTVGKGQRTQWPFFLQATVVQPTLPTGEMGGIFLLYRDPGCAETILPACRGSPIVFLGSPTILPLTVDPHWALSRVVSRHTELQWWHTREVLVIWNTRTAHVNQLTAWRADTTLLWWRRMKAWTQVLESWDRE